jgi:hypothetical protein
VGARLIRVFLFFSFFCASVAQADGLSFYAEGKFKEAIPALISELGQLRSPSELEARVKAAEDIYAQDLTQDLSGLLQFYKQALSSPATQRYLRLRIEATRDALEKELRFSGFPTLERWSMLRLRSKTALKVDHAREGQLRALGMIARREYRRSKAPARLLDFARSQHFLTGFGAEALEEFLELKKGSAQEKKEAFEMLRESYQKEFPKEMPELKREQLEHFRKLAS